MCVCVCVIIIIIIVVQEIKNVGVYFLADLNIDLDEIWYFASFCWLMPNLAYTSNFQRKELC